MLFVHWCKDQNKQSNANWGTHERSWSLKTQHLFKRFKINNLIRKKKYKTKLLMHYCLVAVRHFWQTTLFFSFPPSLFLSPSLSLFTQKCNLNTRVRPKRIWELDKWTSGGTYRYIYGVCPLRDSLLIPHGLIWRLHHYSHESIS